jgi:hypothetical protein
MSTLIAFTSMVYALTGQESDPPRVHAFRVGIELPSQLPVTKAVENALKAMGIRYVNYYVTTNPTLETPESETNEAIMALCDRLGLDFSIACHHLNPAQDTVRKAARRERFEGVVFDELAHIRLMNPRFAAVPPENMLADPASFTSLDRAYEKTLDGYRKLKAQFDALGAPRVTATHVWPELLHLAARAGFTPCPKICKEFYSPVSLAVGMGAAKEYGRDLWVDCDMWYFQLIPGHAPEEVWCNLLLAYWLGADLVYLEGSGYNLLPAGKQGTPFSLMNELLPDRYQLTPHGEMLQRFCKDYLPSHPRAWTFRDVKPIAAIIRFEDGDYGQRSWGGNKLYGSAQLEPDGDTAAWLTLWNVLTHGATGNDGLAYFKGSVAHPSRAPEDHNELTPSCWTQPEAAAVHSFFVPLNGVVVYDSLADYSLLADVPLLFLTGKEVSPKTMAALRRCVKEGAVCVAWGPLAARNGFSQWEEGVLIVPEGEGRFVITDDFAAPEAVAEYASFIGRPDEVRYRFGAHEVVLRRVANNEIEVEVKQTK